MELGKSVCDIALGAFSYCYSLDTMIFKTFNPPTMDVCFFQDSFVAVVPCNPVSYSLYLASMGNLSDAYIDVVKSDTVFTILTVVPNDSIRGMAQIITPHTCPDYEATISATANAGYTFSRWSDGNTQNPRTLTVTQDTVLIAYFASNQSIVDAENDIISIRTANGHILLEGINGEQAYVTDVLGRVVYNATVNERAEIAVKNQGVYFVKIGSRPAQKVVVIR